MSPFRFVSLMCYIVMPFDINVPEGFQDPLSKRRCPSSQTISLSEPVGLPYQRLLRTFNGLLLQAGLRYLKHHEYLIFPQLYTSYIGIFFDRQSKILKFVGKCSLLSLMYLSHGISTIISPPDGHARILHHCSLLRGLRG
jgi:hypothetical protein